MNAENQPDIVGGLEFFDYVQEVNMSYLRGCLPRPMFMLELARFYWQAQLNHRIFTYRTPYATTVEVKNRRRAAAETSINELIDFIHANPNEWRNSNVIKSCLLKAANRWLLFDNSKDSKTQHDREDKFANFIFGDNGKPIVQTECGIQTYKPNNHNWVKPENALYNPQLF